jgi:hypothetical protein
MFINVDTFLWLQDIKSVLDKHNIKQAGELDARLNKPKPTVTVTIPPNIMHNYAPMPPKPTIGRIVHYIDKGGNELPAIIVAISSFTPYQWVYIRAFVWSTYGEDISDFAMYSEYKGVRTWHWPEREREE